MGPRDHGPEQNRDERRDRQLQRGRGPPVGALVLIADRVRRKSTAPNALHGHGIYFYFRVTLDCVCEMILGAPGQRLCILLVLVLSNVTVPINYQPLENPCDLW